MLQIASPNPLHFNTGDRPAASISTTSPRISGPPGGLRQKAGPRPVCTLAAGFKSFQVERASWPGRPCSTSASATRAFHHQAPFQWLVVAGFGTWILSPCPLRRQRQTRWTMSANINATALEADAVTGGDEAYRKLLDEWRSGGNAARAKLAELKAANGNRWVSLAAEGEGVGGHRRCVEGRRQRGRDPAGSTEDTNPSTRLPSAEWRFGPRRHGRIPSERWPW